MANEIHCSVCDALVPQGAQSGPDCGLQLVAQAAPAVYVEGLRFSAWKVTGVALVALVLFAALLQGSHRSRAAAPVDDCHCFDAAIAALSTRAAFEQRCGNAARVEKRGAPDFDPGTTRLIYPQAGGKFRADFRNDQVRGGAVHVFPDAEDHRGVVDGLQALGCGLAP